MSLAALYDPVNNLVLEITIFRCSPIVIFYQLSKCSWFLVFLNFLYEDRWKLSVYECAKRSRDRLLLKSVPLPPAYFCFVTEALRSSKA